MSPRIAAPSEALGAPRVLLACSGLDHAHRGYESFARECFAALRDSEAVRLDLVKGSGSGSDRERLAPTLRRDRAPALRLGQALKVRPFRLEALAFGFALGPLLIRTRPDLVFVSEWDTARVLARMRPLLGLRFRILFSNGGFAESGFERFDHVQQLTPAARDHAIRLGAEPAMHTTLPYGFDVPAAPTLLSALDRGALRSRLGLPAAGTIVVSVAALNRSHKRIDYLIDELASLPTPRPFLLVAGEADGETPLLRRHAAQRLGTDGFDFRTVPKEQVPALLHAADLFALTSLNEMQGRAIVEAAGHGLPCLAHDSPVMRFATGPEGRLADLSRPGALVELIHVEMAGAVDTDRARRAHAYVREQFSWERLAPRYEALLRSVAFANSTDSSSSGEKLAR